ncbi:MAG: hypothetical protein GWP48_11825 [Actinobacteria bacterium]|nr:hypothetical protein [Actinomycetota bacterium]
MISYVFKTKSSMFFSVAVLVLLGLITSACSTDTGTSTNTSTSAAEVVDESLATVTSEVQFEEVEGSQPLLIAISIHV